MKKDSIEYLAYLLDKARTDGSDKAIVFLGAGVSVSAGIPLTNVIVRHIRLKYIKNPIIADAIKNNELDYYKLMGMLTADERRDLFHYYVTREKVKLNIANVYLAQLLKLNYIDYIVTVNFDDLVLRACTLFNFLPPVYDISNIKTITTTDLRKGSVVYLHGQYFGQWLLNNEAELNKVENEVLSLFNTIKTRRTWIVVGYSGNDGIFSKIKSLGSFSNELFWVKKEFSKEFDKHILEFIETPTSNANKIEGYFADSFFLKLHAELSKLNGNLEAPEIFAKPFSYLKSVMQEVNSYSVTNQFEDVNEMDGINLLTTYFIKTCNETIEKAINIFESPFSISCLKQRIVEKSLKEEFTDDLENDFEIEIKNNAFDGAKYELSGYLTLWGIKIAENAIAKLDEKLFRLSFEKFNKAEKAFSNYEALHYNWGVSIYKLAQYLKSDTLYVESIDKFKKAIEINPNDGMSIYNCGCSTLALAISKDDGDLYEDCVLMFKKSLEFNHQKEPALNNLGVAFHNLYIKKQNISFLFESIKSHREALKRNSKVGLIYCNLANSLFLLAKQENNSEIYQECLEKYDHAFKLDFYNAEMFFTWGCVLMIYSKILNKSYILDEAFEKLKKGVELGSSPYNLACCYALIKDRNMAFRYLEDTLIGKKESIDFIEKDDDWEAFKQDADFLNLLAKYR